MSAANTMDDNSSKVVLFDESSFHGSDNEKATLGINSAGIKTQKA